MIKVNHHLNFIEINYIMTSIQVINSLKQLIATIMAHRYLNQDIKVNYVP